MMTYGGDILGALTVIYSARIEQETLRTSKGEALFPMFPWVVLYVYFFIYVVISCQSPFSFLSQYFLIQC